ncbi:acyl-[ACP]--phospholipid O-acyltransferase [soil metagenome]
MPIPAPAPPPNWRSLWGVLAVQTQNAFNDKFAQFVLLGLAVVVLPAAESQAYPHLLALMLSLPFVLFAPVAGWFSDRFSKRTVLLGCLYAQVILLAWIAVALRGGFLELATAGFFLLAIQSTFFSPAKLGIAKELVGSTKLAVASGWMQMLAIVAIVLGSAIGGIAFKHYSHQFSTSPWTAAAFPIAVLCAASVVAIAIGHRVDATPSASPDRFAARLFLDHFAHLRDLFANRPIRLTALGIAYFWFAGAFVQLLVVQVGIEISPDKADVAAVSGLMQAWIGCGIALGSIAVAVLSSQRIELGMVPLGGGGLALSAVAASLVPAGSVSFHLSLAAIGFFGAWFLVPLNAWLQDLADPARRGRVLSASALMDAIAVLLGTGLQLALLKAGLPTAAQFALIGLLTMAATVYVAGLLPQRLLRFMVLSVFRILYRIRPIGIDRIPATGGALMVANHLSYIDSIVLSSASPREIRFVIFDHYLSVRGLSPFLRLLGVIPISKTRAKDAVRTVVAALRAGNVVCIFPEGQLTRTGCLNEIKKGFEIMVRQASTPVIPAYMDGLWGSIFTFERGRFFNKIPYRVPYHVHVTFGQPIPPDVATAPRVRQVLTALSAESLAHRTELEVTLPDSVARWLHRRPWAPAFIETAGKRTRTLTRATAYATARALGRRWHEMLPESTSHVGIFLPASSAAALVHLGVLFAGKIPVALRRPDHLPPTIGALITSPKLVSAPGALDFAAEFRAVVSPRLLLSKLAAYVRPARFARAPCPHRSPGVAIQNPDGTLTEIPALQILANAHQLRDTNLTRPRDRLVATLDPAAPEAATFTLFYPLLRSVPRIFVPQSATPQRLLEILARESATWIVGPLPPGFEPRLHSASAGGAHPYLAHPPTGAVIAVSQPDPPPPTVTAQIQNGTKPGALGCLLPGFAVTASDPDHLHLDGPALPPGGITLAAAQDDEGFLSPTTGSGSQREPQVAPHLTDGEQGSATLADPGEPESRG